MKKNKQMKSQFTIFKIMIRMIMENMENSKTMMSKWKEAMAQIGKYC